MVRAFPTPPVQVVVVWEGARAAISPAPGGVAAITAGGGVSSNDVSRQFIDK